MKDPAVGRTRAERALGEHTPGKKKSKAQLKAPRSQVNDIRVAHMGQFDGVRASYGRYNVSEQAQDVLNRSLRNRGER